MIDNIRLSQRAKEQLITLKRHTGITNWNVLCRWAFCLSMAEHAKPRDEDIPTDSSVEMTWKTFGGSDHEIYIALLKHKCQLDGIVLEHAPMYRYLKQHLQRGIGYLVQLVKSKDPASIFTPAIDSTISTQSHNPN